MPNFRRKGGVLQKLPETARKVQGNITFDPGIRLEKKIKLLLRGYMFTPYVQIS